MGNLLDAYRQHLLSHSSYHKYHITDLLIGPSFTLLSLNNRWWGMALTMFKVNPDLETYDLYFMQHVKKLPITWILENMRRLSYGNSIVSALSNAFFQEWLAQHPERIQYTDPIDIFYPGPTKIVLFGYFKQYALLFEKQNIDWFVVEKNLDVVLPKHRHRALAFEENEWKNLVQQSELNIITGASVVNETISVILEHLSSSSKNILTGPSAGGIIDELIKFPIHAVATSIVHSPRLAKKYISLGSSAKNLFHLKALRKVCVLLK